MQKPYFQPLIRDGQTFELDHLEPFSFEVHSAMAKKNLRVHVTFSNHCFTRSFDPEINSLADVIVDRYGARPRVFCPTRYHLSHSLRGLISRLGESPRMKVWETTAQRNWCYSIMIGDADGRYHLFFELRRAAKDRRQWQDLQLVVESAYPEGNQAGPCLRGAVAFVLLCGKVYLGLPTATRR